MKRMNETFRSSRRFHARMGDDELGGLQVGFGLAEVLMEIEPEGHVVRFVGIDANGRPVFRHPSRRLAPFDFSGLFPETSVLDEDRITAEEFEAMWRLAAAEDGQD
jgi:hypothetical protein